VALMLLAVLVALGIASLLAGWLVGFILPEMGAISSGIVVLGTVLLLAALVIDVRRGGALASSRGRLGFGTSLRVGLVLAIVFVANVLSASNYRRFDFSGLGQFTLSAQTKDFLRTLDQPVEATAFFSPGPQSGIAGFSGDLLAEYRNYSRELTVRTIDPQISPDQARQYGVDRTGAVLGVIVFSGKGGQQQVLGPQIIAGAEHAFTSAIMMVSGKKQPKVYFVTGHGEQNLVADYDSAAGALRDNLFDVAEIDLSASDIPADASLVIMAGPRHGPSASELDKLQAYAKGGGRLLVLVDPDPPPEVRTFLARWWMGIDGGAIVEPTSHVYPNLDVPLVTKDRNNFDLAEAYFPGATAVLPAKDAPPGVETGAIAWTTADAWLEKDLAPGKAPAFDVATERKGPLAIGAFVSAPAEVAGKKSRMIVVGDSDFAADAHFHNAANGDLFLAAVKWLTSDVEIVSIGNRVIASRRLILDPGQARFLQASSIGLLPLLLLFAGGFAWWRKR
jgi:hypothetical protein